MILDDPIVTDRLVLKTLGESDANATYLDWLCDPEVVRYMEIRHAHYTIQSLRDFIDAMNTSDSNLQLGVFIKDGLRHIGNVKLGPILSYHRRADLGLLIGDKTVWGQGYATEVISAVTTYAFNTLNIHRISAGCYPRNIGSMKAFLKCGYQEDAHLEDFFLSDGEWQDCILMYRLEEADAI